MKNVPFISFRSERTTHLGFEIVPIERIAQGKKEHIDHNPELAHQLKFYNLIYFTEGKGRHFIDFHWYDVAQGTLVYLAKEQVSAFDFSSNLKGYCIVFTDDFFVDCFSSLTSDFVFRLFNPQLFSPLLQIPAQSDFDDYFYLMKKEYEQSSSFNYGNIINALFIVLISKAESIKQEQTSLLIETTKITVFKNFKTLLEQNFKESRSADYYAKKLAITYKHLNSICKDLVNKTAKNVIDDFIIIQAKRSLINSSVKSNELAYQLGFEDPTNFSKYFKKHTGLTPNLFAKFNSTIHESPRV